MNLVRLTIALLVGVILSGLTNAYATEPTPAELPKVMTPLDLARLDAAQAHIEVLKVRVEAIVANANSEIAAYEATSQKILDAYKIDRTAMAKKLIEVDAKTGAITRHAPPAPPNIKKK